ncbi:putative Phox domain, PX domain superfamily, sorting nexin [Plasmopara halstedii]
MSVARPSRVTSCRMSLTTQRSQRVLAIDSFSRAPATGVWFYRVDVSICQKELSVPHIDEGDSEGADDRYCETMSLSDASDSEHYSILRRYNDFLKLYEQVCLIVAASEGNSHSVPPFPTKEMLPSLVVLLWRVSPSMRMLEERRAKFEALLVWIENHPTARNCSAFVEFLGKPPQTREGYVSLKGYTSPDWLSSLRQVTRNAEDRKRRDSGDSISIRSLPDRSNSDAYSVLSVSRHQRFQAKYMSTCVLGKRHNCSPNKHRRYEPPYKKRTLLANNSKLSYADQGSVKERWT